MASLYKAVNGQFSLFTLTEKLPFLGTTQQRFYQQLSELRLQEVDGKNQKNVAASFSFNDCVTSTNYLQR